MQPSIEGAFTIDADGLLKMQATELHSGKEVSMELKQSGGLTKKQIEAIMADGEIQGA